MEPFKLENFEKTHPGVRLAVESVGLQDVAWMKERLAQRLALPHETEGSTLVRAIALRAVPLPGLDASSDGFDVGRVLKESVGVGPECDVYLNWHWFEGLDRMRAGDFARCFEDVWYPSADDLDVIGVDGEWVLSIAHHGGLSLFAPAGLHRSAG